MYKPVIIGIMVAFSGCLLFIAAFWLCYSRKNKEEAFPTSLGHIYRQMSCCERFMFLFDAVLVWLDIVTDFLFASEVISIAENATPEEDIYKYRDEFATCGKVSITLGVVGFALFIVKMFLIRFAHLLFFLFFCVEQLGGLAARAPFANNT